MGSEPYSDSVGGGRTWKDSVLAWLCPARKTRQKHTGQFSDREFDSGPELVAVEENAKRLLMGITKHQYCKGTGWGGLGLCTQMCFRVLEESVPSSLLVVPNDQDLLPPQGPQE